MRSLERLVSDHHRRMYGRDRNCSVLSEEEVSIERIASEVLSSGVCGVCVCVCVLYISLWVDVVALLCADITSPSHNH